MKKSILYIIIGIIGIVIIVGGKMYMDEKKLQEEMIQVVYSEEAKEIYEESLRNLDPKAFTVNGIIQSYEIQKESIKHNPMGGIMLTIYVNGNPQLYIHKTLNKDSSGSLKAGGGGFSNQLNELLQHKEKEDD